MIKTILYKLIIIAALSVSFTLISSSVSYAIDSSEFQPGRIIDDEIFYNKDAMGDAQSIQEFIRNHTPANCDTWGTQPSGYGNRTNAEYAQQVMGWPGPPYVCLQNYHENPSTGETSFEKGGGSFGGGLNAGQIIWNASQKYSINPQVLLVTLRKESLNLFSDSWPMKSQYKYAMGYACPDSGPNYSANCDTTKAGFYKQVELAAWQLRYYYDHMGSYNYSPGRWNTIQYNKEPSCGTKDVYIENYATASLYIYTPYTPNTEALNSYPGEAPCGAYGNRNFWFMFNEWFGSTIITNAKILSRPYVNSLGWTNEVKDNGTIGSVGQGKALEAVMIQGEVEYSTYNQVTGWQPTVNLGMVSGGIGTNTPLEAIKIKLIGSLYNRYDIYYRAHVSNIGWMNWTKNGLPAGTTGAPQTNRLEAVEIKLVLKGLAGPASGSDSYRNISTVSPNPSISAQITAHVSNHGWQPTVVDKMVAGTVKQKRAIEAIKLSLVNNTSYQGNIVYSSHLAGIGWQDYITNNTLSGTIKQSRQMEAFRINLTGELSEHYDIWYRAQIQDYGWLGWAKNNQPAGSSGANKRLEALEVRILDKNTTSLSGASAFFNPKNKPIPNTYTFTYSTHAKDLGWLPTVTSGEQSGTTSQSRRLEALKIASLKSSLGDISIGCSAFSADLGWSNQEVFTNAVCGTTGQSKALQAIKLSLSGSVARNYTLTYRTHVSTIGWMQWRSANEIAGTPGQNQIEAIEVTLTEKQ